MLCEHCGKQIPGDSKFCRYCGQSVVPQLPNAASDDISLPPPSDATTPKDSRKPLLTIFIVVTAICVAISFYARNTVPVKQTNAISASNSEYKNRLIGLQPQLIYYSEQMVQKALINPTNVVFTHDWDAFYNNGALLTNSGTVTYKNALGKDITQTFETTIIFNDQSAYFLALKLDDGLRYDYRFDIDTDGVIIATDIRFGPHAYGEAILENPYNPDKWAKNAADYHNSEDEITLPEFTALQLGTTYKEACAAIGSSGIEKSRATLLGSETAIYTWEGIGKKDASATLTFVDNLLIAKEQEGLK